MGDTEVHTAEPAAEEVPGAQALQLEELGIEEKVPGTQRVQEVTETL